MGNLIVVSGIVCHDNGVVSGQNTESEYGSEGTLSRQKPFFEKLSQKAGRPLDLSNVYNGSINLSIDPFNFEILKPDWYFHQLHWYNYKSTNDPKIENFSFVEIQILCPNSQNVTGYIYYPDPKTKRSIFHGNMKFEIIAPFIDGLSQGAELTFSVDGDKVRIL